jgi:tetratricopeptide (TPR) repeat protein
MRTCSLVRVLFLTLVAAPFTAQGQRFTINTSTPEGRLLLQVKEESDDARKMALADQFLTQYPKHEGVTWVYSLMVPSCANLGQFDKAFAAAEKVLAQNPADVDTAYAAVKAAELKKDPDAVRKWAVQGSDLARKVVQTPKTGEEAEDAYKLRVDSAKQLDTYTEYALFASAMATGEAAKKAALFKTLEERAPESAYLPQGYGLYFQALLQAGDAPAAMVLADKLMAKGQANEEMVATAGDFTLRQNKDPQKVIDYSSKLVEMVNARTKPATVTDADWQKYRTHFLGWGQWMAGVAYGVQGKYAESNKMLRDALPQLEGREEYKAAALYNLGIANSRLKNLADADKYFDQCAAMSSPYEATCKDNLKAIRATHRVVK